jgi:hypothetical protein
MEPREDRSGPLRLRLILYLALLVAGIFAAWQAHAYWVRPDRAATAPPETGHRWRWDHPTPGPSATNAADFIDSLQRQVGPTPLDGEPGGIDPPPDTVRQTGYQVRSADRVVEFAAYNCPAGGEAALAYVQTQLERQAYQRSATQRPRPDQTWVFYRAGDTTVTVRLRKAGPDRTIDSLAVSVVRPVAPVQ